MKRIYWFIVLLLLVAVSPNLLLAEQKDSGKAINGDTYKLTLDIGDNTKSMIQNGGGSLEKFLEVVNSKANYAFPVYVKQASVKGKVSSSLFVIFIVLPLVLTVPIFRRRKVLAAELEDYEQLSKEEKSNKEFVELMFRAGYYLMPCISFIVFIVFMSQLPDIASLVYNPEYEAIKMMVADARMLLH